MDPVQEQLDAYNSRDLDRFLNCYTSGILVEDGQGNRMMEGIEAMRTAYRDLFEKSPELHCRLVHRIRINDYVVDEEEVTGLGGRPPDQVVNAVAVYRIEGDKIAHVRFLK